MMQHVEHDDAGQASIRKGQPVRVGDNVDSGKGWNVHRDDVGTRLFDVRGSAADVENAAIAAVLIAVSIK